VPEFAITFARSARKQLQVLDQALAHRIVGRIESLAVTPRPVGCVKLEGGAGLWRIRVGDYRVIYEIDDDRSMGLEGSDPANGPEARSHVRRRIVQRGDFLETAEEVRRCSRGEKGSVRSGVLVAAIKPVAAQPHQLGGGNRICRTS
jgi:mRNA interferase RelE/StbE